MIRRLFIVILLLPGLSWAGDSIHIEWGYTPPSEPAVTGYKLYQEGAAVCTYQGATTMSGDCDVTLAKQVTNFTLTATFADNTESPHSAPFAFDRGDKVPDPPASGIEAPVLRSVEYK